MLKAQQLALRRASKAGYAADCNREIVTDSNREMLIFWILAQFHPMVSCILKQPVRQVTAEGNVNVTRVGKTIMGPGSFIDVSQSTKRVHGAQIHEPTHTCTCAHTWTSTHSQWFFIHPGSPTGATKQVRLTP